MLYNLCNHLNEKVRDIVDELYNPADEIEPDQITMYSVHQDRAFKALIQVEGHDEPHP